MKYIYIFIFALLTAGCSPKHYIDISKDPKFNNIIGQKYQSLIALKTHGVSLGIEGNWEVDYVYLTPPPGIGGNQIKFYGDLNSNKTFKVVGVAKNAYSSIFGLYYEVKILNSSKYNQYKIYIDVPNKISTPNKGLDKNVFKLLPIKT